MPRSLPLTTNADPELGHFLRCHIGTLDPVFSYLEALEVSFTPLGLNVKNATCVPRRMGDREIKTSTLTLSIVRTVKAFAGNPRSP